MPSQWWRDAVVYEIYIRSYADSDGDGVGDLEGIRTHLDHLVDLGVDALWITPFYPSPMADHGYDVADYTDVEPMFGDLAAFDRLLAEAHTRDLRVIVDIVPNHTSSAHSWFRAAVADPSSPMRARYFFRDGRDGGASPPNNWTSVFGGPAWTRDEASGEWYLHLFDQAQPDLDWRNPEVHEEFRRILRFWLDRGVDGFRIDVAHGLYKSPTLGDEDTAAVAGAPADVGRPQVWDQPEVVDVYRDWRRLRESYVGDRMMVGEVFILDVERVKRYVGDDRLHQAFNFTVFRTQWGAAALRRTIEKALDAFHPPTWVLSNHDLTRHVSRYGGGDLGRRRGLAVTAVLLALPGSPYLYQGEELGLEESDVPPDRRTDPTWFRTAGKVIGRDGCRTPIPWTAGEPGHGFTTGEPWLPFGADAAAQAVDTEPAVLQAYRSMLAVRRSLRGALGDEVTWLDAPDDVLAFRREGGLVCILNSATESVELPVTGKLLLATADGAGVSGDAVTVSAASTVWLRV
ncbi:MAG: alpha-glucosidase [Actinomycetota bacterium]|nr:alpha-glucosidase [Actinomycetota bacterium]